MKSLHCGFAALLFSAACARGNPAAAPVPEVPQPSSPITFPTAKSWTLTPDEDFHSYSSRSVTTLELQDEARAVRDSFVVTLDFTVRTERNGELSRVAGTLDRLQREPESPAPQPQSPAVMPFSFAGRFISGGLVLDSAGSRPIATVPDCESAGLNQMSVVQRNLFLVPLTLRTGATWTDSSTVAICSGGIPVELTSVRTYTVTGEAPGSRGGSIVIERSEMTRVAGEGTQGQHRIGLQAAGSGSARLLLDPASGLLSQAEGESRTTVTIRSSGRQQRFLQTVRERTTRVR